MKILSKELTAISGHIIPGKRLSYWENVIEEWSLLIDRYCRVTQDDAPYWYTERANIGVLAGACWRAGYVALEEFQYKKGYRNKPKWSGRADLWFCSDKTSILVEAKYKCISLDSGDHIQTITPILNEAKRNAEQSKKGRRDLTAIGMVFVPVYIPVSADVDDINEKIDTLVKILKKELAGKMVFWHFPSASRMLIGSSEKKYWPGLFVVAEEI